MASPVKVFSLVDDDEQEELKAAIGEAYSKAGSIGPRARTAVRPGAADETSDIGGLQPGEKLKLPPFDELIGIDPSVYRQIEAAINSGKTHLMFYGPPGTGKTTLARRVAGVLNGGNWELITGSADWSSQDIIGGYQPMASGSIEFFPGVLLRNFDRPLIIDELNRCDIDKVIGPLFTVLSGQATTLPYRVDASDRASPQYRIIPHAQPDSPEHVFAPGPAWRLIATINSIDKASLYQMSYALSRRFGWIYVNSPRDTKAFIQSYLETALKQEPRSVAGIPPLAQIWDAINAVRVIGPAPILDAINALEQLSPGADLLGAPEGDVRTSYIDVFDLFMLPLLDGILGYQAETIVAKVVDALGLAADSPEADLLKRRVIGVAV